MAFNGDTIAEERVVQILANQGIRTVVETGTRTGDTTRFFSSYCKNVVTIEVNKVRFDSLRLEDLDNVKAIQGSSPLIMRRIIPELEKPLLFYLDAHNYEYWPLLDELAVIAQAKLKPIIIIHDCKVPDTDLGFDSYGGQDLEFSYVKNGLQTIYGKDMRCEYNSVAMGGRRGILYVFPKRDTKEK